MAKYMTREEFFHILLRQRQSNLTVKDFCANEGYNRSQFYDWRSRFNISDEELKSGSVPTAGMDGFVPISIDNNNVSAPTFQSQPALCPQKTEKTSGKCTVRYNESLLYFLFYSNMGNNAKLIVVSAVGLRQGGTLTILKECLQYLSTCVREGHVRVIAIVHDRRLAEFNGIEYIELPDVIKSWTRRLWCEYITMHRISQRLPGIDLWLSLHDTTPRVIAKRQAVYCQTSFPFYKLTWRDFYFNYKIALFSLFTRYAYRINVHRNQYMIVQQSWLREGLSRMLGVGKEKFIVAPPRRMAVKVETESVNLPCFTFLYASAPDCHKNFEVLCQAARLLEKEKGKGCFKVVVTLSGKENRYGHPHAETLERLAKWGVSLYNTKDRGAVSMYTDGREYGIQSP